MPPCRFNLGRLRDGIKPFRLYWFPRLRSTNDHAAALRKRGELFAPAIVLTGHQTAGRGRGSNTWFSGSGSLTVTFALPIEEELAPHQLPLVAGLAVRSAAAELLGEGAEVGLKWPNDLLSGERKLAGLLCERVHRVDLIGLGLNVNLEPAQAPLPLRKRITSLSVLAGRRFEMTDVLITVARHLRRMTARRGGHPYATVLEEYDRHHLLIGREVSVTFSAGESPVVGRCEGLDELGRLVIRDSATHRRHAVIAGHVELAG